MVQSLKVWPLDPDIYDRMTSLSAFGFEVPIPSQRTVLFAGEITSCVGQISTYAVKNGSSMENYILVAENHELDHRDAFVRAIKKVEKLLVEAYNNKDVSLGREGHCWPFMANVRGAENHFIVFLFSVVSGSGSNPNEEIAKLLPLFQQAEVLTPVEAGFFKENLNTTPIRPPVDDKSEKKTPLFHHSRH